MSSLQSRTPFSGDELARNPAWALKTDEKTRKLKGRRMFRLRALKDKSLPPVYITDQNWLFYTVNKNTFTCPLPDTYRKFMRVLIEYTSYVNTMTRNPPHARGWDGYAEGVRIRL